MSWYPSTCIFTPYEIPIEVVNSTIAFGSLTKRPSSLLAGKFHLTRSGALISKMAANGGIAFQEKVSRLLSREHGKPVIKPNRRLALKDAVANRKPKKGGKTRTFDWVHDPKSFWPNVHKAFNGMRLSFCSSLQRQLVLQRCQWWWPAGSGTTLLTAFAQMKRRLFTNVLRMLRYVTHTDEYRYMLYSLMYILCVCVCVCWERQYGVCLNSGNIIIWTGKTKLIDMQVVKLHYNSTRRYYKRRTLGKHRFLRVCVCVIVNRFQQGINRTRPACREDVCTQNKPQHCWRDIQTYEKKSRKDILTGTTEGSKGYHNAPVQSSTCSVKTRGVTTNGERVMIYHLMTTFCFKIALVNMLFSCFMVCHFFHMFNLFTFKLWLGHFFFFKGFLTIKL